MRITSLVFCLMAFPYHGQSQTPGLKGSFRAPLDIEMILSGNFAEIRSDHFHSGIDIKTRGTTGFPVYAASDGYVSRINVSAGGFGKAVYLTHLNGKTTVYGHLDRFAPDIDSYVRSRQYARHAHAINIYPRKEDFTVRNGDLIAWSGNSGYSLGPHLHFEIRNSVNQHPENILLYGFDVGDSISPEFVSLWMYQFHTTPDGFEYLWQKDACKVLSDQGMYVIETGNPLVISRKFGIGIEAHDLLNLAGNKCGLYSVDLFLDNRLIMSLKMDEFGFDESRYINSFIDYEEQIRNDRNIMKLFLEPGNRLSIYKYVLEGGFMNLSDTCLHRIKIIIRDAYMNSSQLGFGIRYLPPEEESVPEYGRVFRYDEINEFESEGIRIRIPEHALYTDIAFTYVRASGDGRYLSDIHSVNNPLIPVHLPYEVSIRSCPIPAALRNKTVLLAINDQEETSFMGGSWEDGWINGSLLSFGRFAVGLDTLAPVIAPLNIGHGKDMSSDQSIRFLVTDDLSGIRSYDGYIDNQWALFEYHSKNDLVVYDFDQERMNSGSLHEVELYVIDNRENLSYYHTEFYW